MAGNEHFMYGLEPSYGVWTPPDHAIPVRSVNLTGGQPLMIPEETGGGRGDRPGAVGEISVGPGDVVSLLHPVGVPRLLMGAFATRAVAAAGTGFRNTLLIDDDVAFDTYSFQKRYTGTLAESLRGNKMAGFTISARAREFAMITMNWVGKDSTITPGGTWSDGVAAPAVIDPVPYDPYVGAFKFYEGVLRLGGTVALTAGEMVVTGGTERVDLDNIEIAANFNPSTDAYGVNLGDRTLQDIPEGRREITVRFDPNFGQTGAEFYNAWKNGARAVLELFFQGPEFETGQRYEMKITLPWVIYSNGANPELNAQYGLKRHTVEGRAFVDPSLGNGRLDIGIVVQSDEDLTA